MASIWKISLYNERVLLVVIQSNTTDAYDLTETRLSQFRIAIQKAGFEPESGIVKAECLGECVLLKDE